MQLLIAKTFAKESIRNIELMLLGNYITYPKTKWWQSLGGIRCKTSKTRPEWSWKIWFFFIWTGSFWGVL